MESLYPKGLSESDECVCLSMTLAGTNISNTVELYSAKSNYKDACLLRHIPSN